MYPNVHRSTVYNSQDMEATYIVKIHLNGWIRCLSLRDWIYKQIMVRPPRTIQFLQLLGNQLELSQLGSQLSISQFFFAIVSNSREIGENQVHSSQTNSIRNSCLAHLKLPHASNLQIGHTWNLLNVMLPHSMENLWVSARQEWWMVGWLPCYSKSWVSRFCLFSLGWSSFISYYY